MKQQKKFCSLPYERRLQKYHEEKQRLLQKDPMLNAAELDKQIKKLADKWRI